jgi:hypothetical protein
VTADAIVTAAATIAIDAESLIGFPLADHTTGGAQ